MTDRPGSRRPPEASLPLARLLERHWHHGPETEVLDILEANPDKGLDLFTVRSRQESFGPNAITPRKGRGPLVRFLLQFHQPLVYILLLAAAVTAALKEVIDAGVIFGVVLVNAVVGFLQEARALQAIEALARSLTSVSTVLRAGAKDRIPSQELVPGDIVLLQSGDKVPADLRLLEVRDLQINESALTGESLPSQKRRTTLPRDTSLGDRCNMAYSSTIVTYGTGTGVVVATGDATEIGRISEMIASVRELETPLTRKIEKFSRVLLVAILLLAGLAFLVGKLRGESTLEMLMAAVALAVGAIPEGLPAAVTIIMAAGVSRMARRHAIIRRLPAVETLGGTTVICSDKTGTLTQNQMTVQEIHAGGERFRVTGSGDAPGGRILRDGAPPGEGDAVVDLEAAPALRECLLAGLLCNNADLSEEGGRWKAQGDPTEAALLVSARRGGLRREDIAAANPRLDAIPFESEHQYMVTLHAVEPGGPRVAYVKGSSEGVLARCRDRLGTAGVEPLDSEAVHQDVEEMAARGLRVLALARAVFDSSRSSINHSDVEEGLTLLGLQAMMDPPRPEARAAVAACQEAGVRVKMITGDHAVTARAIARQIGIAGAGEEHTVVTSRELEPLSDQELIEVADRTAVFARVAPEHKLRLVQALQSRGHVVAMTGDGVNDAPALRRADIGVAMALGGTEAAREAADMILTDDNFASIEAAVEEGRGVYDNLRKFITWTLPTNGAEGLVLLVAILLGVTLPVLPVQILWINMMTAVTLGMALAFEPKEAGLMKRPPVRPQAPILSAEMVQRIIMVSLLLCAAAFGVFEWEVSRGSTPAEARTAAVGMIVVGEMFYLFNCRSLSRSFMEVGLFSNPWIWVGTAIMAVAQLLFTYATPLNRMFHSRPLRPEAWVIILVASVILSAVVGLEKGIRRRRAARR